MVFRNIFIILIFSLIGSIKCECPCEGVVIDGTDQSHCWQLETREYTTWTSADTACQSVGGHLGHPDQSDFETVWNYVKGNTSLPVITGIVAGNVEIPIYAKMCPNNVFYGTISNTTDLFSNTASLNETCSFMTTDTSELVFKSCSTNAKVLCDRPLEKDDYCSIMANCTTTTTVTTTISDSTTVPTTTTVATSTIPSTTSDESSSTSLSTSTSVSSSASTLSSTPTTVVSDTVDSSTSTVATTTTATTTKSEVSSTSASVSATTSSSTKCLAHQFKLFGMCIDWRALLAMILIGLLIFLCCCICHFCLSACMWCSPKKREKENFPKFSPEPPKTLETISTFKKITQNISMVRDPILPLRSSIAPVTYDEKPDLILPPPAVLPEPVIITVPEKHESVYGFHSKEVIHIHPEKPETREIGVMTEPVLEVVPDVVVVAPAPITKRKKVVKKPKKMFIPSTIDPIDEDIAEDVAIPDVRAESPGGKSIAPMGDAFGFKKNPKPLGPDMGDFEKPPEKELGGEELEKPEAPRKPAAQIPDPRGIESPPMANSKPISFSPIPDDSDDELPAVMNKIPSPPSQRKPNNPKASPVPLDDDSAPFNAPEVAKPPLRNKRLNDPPVINGGSNDKPKSNNPFANLSTPSRNNNEEPQAEPFSRAPSDVGMRAARGNLGGVVKGGGGGGDAPTGWKPWAKGNHK